MGGHHPLLRWRPGPATLAEAVAEAAVGGATFAVLYPDEASLRDKIHAVATKVYGADGVDYSERAARQLDTYEAAGFGHLPVCIAKTHLSISSDPKLKGAPTGWTLPVREVRASVGAGFVYPICGDMRTMPGLGAHPGSHAHRHRRRRTHRRPQLTRIASRSTPCGASTTNCGIRSAAWPGSLRARHRGSTSRR
jgi:hypothetical protein